MYVIDKLSLPVKLSMQFLVTVCLLLLKQSPHKGSPFNVGKGWLLWLLLVGFNLLAPICFL